MNRRKILIGLVLVMLMLTCCACSSTKNMSSIDFLLTKPTVQEADKKFGKYTSTSSTTLDYSLNICGVNGEIEAIFVSDKIEPTSQAVAWSWSSENGATIAEMEKWRDSVMTYLNKKYGDYSKETINVWDAYVWRDTKTDSRIYFINPEKLSSIILCVDYADVH